MSARSGSISDISCAVIRDGQGVRSTFLEKTHSEIVNIDTCKDPTKLRAVESSSRFRQLAVYRSYRKATKRRREVEGQIALFDFTRRRYVSTSTYVHLLI